MQATDVRRVYAAGTAYQVTNSSAAVDFGTTDPSLTLNAPGTWLIMSRATLKYNAATFAANRTITLKLRRTNNTAADVTGASTAVPTRVTDTVTDLFGPLVIPPVLYSTDNAGDIIAMYIGASAAPSAGSLDVTEAEIIAIRLY